jgi:hypothetical protein
MNSLEIVFLVKFISHCRDVDAKTMRRLTFDLLTRDWLDDSFPNSKGEVKRFDRPRHWFPPSSQILPLEPSTQAYTSYHYRDSTNINDDMVALLPPSQWE